MAKNVPLNSIDHQNLKVITQHAAELGDNVWYTPTFPAEFRSVQAYYPIFFNKDPNTGKFFSVALFGFESQENLFLDGNGWQAGYVPLTVARQPFLIGVQTVNEFGEEKEQRMLHIDLDNPRVNEEHGEALFLPHGGNTPFLDRAADMLETIHQGLVDNDKFIALLEELELLEPFTLDITLNDQSQYQMQGFYAINEERLAVLSDEALGKLHFAGHLQAIYMAIASQGNIRHLMNKKNARLGL